MKRFIKLRRSLKRAKRPLKHVKKVKHVRWFIPGWVFYEYYRVHKGKGHNHIKSISHGLKAEVIRLGAFASLPIPGTYEITTTGLALIKKKIEGGEIEKFSLKAFKVFMPVSKIKGKGVYLEIIKRKEKRYVRIFYKNKNKQNNNYL